MKRVIIIIIMLMSIAAYAQLERDQLSLDISKADAANTEKLKAFLWKQESIVTVNGEEKLTVLNEFSLNEDGTVNITNIDSDTDVKQKRGIRGRIQESTAESNLDYANKAIDLATDYTFMTKGQLLDFFSKAVITEKEGVIEATGTDIFMKGDKFTVKVESDTKLFLYKQFSTMMGEDPISGEIVYDKFTSGISHASSSVLNLPAKGAVIKSTNRDYVQKVQ
jgi:hypothetical protein